jgi:LPS-assembly lipoprotein
VKKDFFFEKKKQKTFGHLAAASPAAYAIGSKVFWFFFSKNNIFLLLTLSGCGFHPLYAPGGAQDADLSAVFVDIIPDRSGQLLRQALQERLEGSDNAAAKRFVLSVSYGAHVIGIGIQNDNSSTRTRVSGDATWSLRAVGAVAGTTQITGGTVRTLDGYNVINEQFFYSDLAQDAVYRRVADALADQITQALSVYFRAHPSAG